MNSTLHKKHNPYFLLYLKKTIKHKTKQKKKINNINISVIVLNNKTTENIFKYSKVSLIILIDTDRQQ